MNITTICALNTDFCLKIFNRRFYGFYLGNISVSIFSVLLIFTVFGLGVYPLCKRSYQEQTHFW